MSVWEKILNLFKALFSKHPVKDTLATLNSEEVRRERIRIEQTELKITKEIEDLERQKEAFFRKGVEGGSERQRLQIARKIKELDGLTLAKDRQLTLISKNLRVLNGVAQLKENERLLKDLGMEGLVGKMDLVELQAYIEQATIEGQFQMERFTKLLGSLDEADATFQVGDEDEDTLKILNAMQTAAQVGTEGAIEEGVEQVSKLLKKPALVEA